MPARRCSPPLAFSRSWKLAATTCRGRPISTPGSSRRARCRRDASSRYANVFGSTARWSSRSMSRGVGRWHNTCAKLKWMRWPSCFYTPMPTTSTNRRRLPLSRRHVRASRCRYRVRCCRCFASTSEPWPRFSMPRCNRSSAAISTSSKRG